MFESLRGRVVIVTGAGRGFGRLMAVALVGTGANVVGTAVRNEDELAETQRLCDAIRARGFSSLLADVSDWDDCSRTVTQAQDQHGVVDCLINNAARGPKEANADFFANPPKFWDTPVDAFERMVAANLTGVFQMTKLVMPGMLASGFGRIINISTSRPTMVMQGLANYGALKAAVEASTVTWARDLDGSGVTANVLLPGGASDTDLIPGGTIGDRSIAGFEQGKGRVGDEGRLEGLLPPEVMVPPTLWLCADESRHINGRRLVAKDWDPDLPPAEAAERCMTLQRDAPDVM